MKTINLRRSVRTFTDAQVEDSKVELLVKAGMQAPSAGNQRPWELIVVKNPETLEKLSKASSHAGCTKNAPMAIVILGNTDNMIYRAHYEQDLGACTQNILLECVEQGLGSVWLGLAPFEDRFAAVRDIFGLGANMLPYAILPIGYPKNEDANYFLDRFQSEKVHYEEY